MEIKILSNPVDVLGYDPADRSAIGEPTGKLKIICSACGCSSKIGNRTSCKKFMHLTGWQYNHGAHGWTCPRCKKSNEGVNI